MESASAKPCLTRIPIQAARDHRKIAGCRTRERSGEQSSNGLRQAVLKKGRRLVENTEPNSYPSANCAEPEPVDTRRWSSAKIRWPMAIFCFVIAAIHLVPAAIIFAEWRLEAGVFTQPRGTPPVLECSGLAAVGVAFLSVATGLAFRRQRYVVGGLLLFLVVAVFFVAYGIYLNIT